MELTGELKEKVEKIDNKDEAKKVIGEAAENAGMLLSEDELDSVAGGELQYSNKADRIDPNDRYNKFL